MFLKVTVDPDVCAEGAEEIGLVEKAYVYCEVVGVAQTEECIYLTLGLFPLPIEDLFPKNRLFVYPIDARIAIYYDEALEKNEARLECFFEHEDGNTHFVCQVELEQLQQIPSLSKLMRL